MHYKNVENAIKVLMDYYAVSRKQVLKLEVSKFVEMYSEVIGK